jgi:GT2 family glycosyltransferase
MSQAISPARTSRITTVPIGLAPLPVDTRPCVRGKFIFVGGEKFYIRGVTYGTFRPDEDGGGYPDPEVVERDFIQMATSGINAVRTYTVPPRWLLDAALRHELRVMVGLPWEQHIAFLDQKGVDQSIEERVRAGVRSSSEHPAILCYAVGNEIPASIVRWHGRRRVERYIERLYRAAKAEDPKGIVTYVNFPSTEYLQLPFLDLFCFNVYLEARQTLEDYLARLQNIAGDRPLILAEIGLDSRRHGCETQAHTLDWQVRSAFASGCAGTFVFAWTDEWYRGGYSIDDWDFGLTDRQRRPKPALESVDKAFAEVPFPPDLSLPRISVIVCSYNGAHTIRDCFEGLLKLEYPNYEVIVVDDGSTDETASIAGEYGFRVISTENDGLSNARNTGFKAATGEIVAYIDDDAYPDPHWLTYLATTLINSTHAGVGGPNIAPPGDGQIADCIANAPGGPVHVLLSDREAEHIPGCNMAFRKASLEAVGGFDPQFRVAGDDVDVCWQLQKRGLTLGFSPAALVWHHRRNSLRAYWKQQKGYGKAEALLEKKWPEKYNSLGHLNWAGRVYGKGLAQTLGWRRARIYQGIWGCAPFQSLYQPAPGTLSSLPTMPEWYLIIISLAALSALGVFWTPMLFNLALLFIVTSLSLIQAGLSAARARFTSEPGNGIARLKWSAVIAFLHLLQPLARLCGRLRHGLSPWRFSFEGLSLPWRQTVTIWSEQWKSPEERLRFVEAALQAAGVYARRAGDYDRWDLEVRGGIFGVVRLRMAIEEHGAGTQLIRFRSWPRCSGKAIVLVLLSTVFSVGAAFDQAWAASLMLAGIALFPAVRTFQECAGATCAILSAMRAMRIHGLRDQVSESLNIADEESPYALLARNHLDQVSTLLNPAYVTHTHEAVSEPRSVAHLDVDGLSLETAEQCTNTGD